MEGIAKLFPPNILPQEILTDQEDRVRAMIVDSANPALTAADSTAFGQALDALELLVVIDVAKTETALKAHYILPAASQFEKTECTFFTFGFPEVWFHLRRPLLSPEGGTLTEPEIYFRLLVALKAIPERFLLLEKALQADSLMRVSRFFPLALAGMLKLKPHWQAYLPVILYSVMRQRTSFGLTTGLPDESASAASLWGVTQLFSARYPRAVARAGLNANGTALGQALFERVLASDRPVLVAKFSFEETWDMVKTANRKVSLAIPQLLSQIPGLAKNRHSLTSKDYPFLLMAGERRAYNANQIFRTAKWRKTDHSGGLRIHPQDMVSLGLADNDEVIVRSSKGQVQVSLIVDEGILPGVVSLPHGYGMRYVEKGQTVTNGPAINLLTDMHACDPIAKTPFHKQVPVNIIPAATGLSA
jgi:anaerobic selenocysteine-containing dehydrogenase